MTDQSAQVEAYWRECCRARPDLAGVSYRVRSFGNSPQLSQRLLELIRSGEKTGTFALLAEFEGKGEPLPKRGDCFVVTDGADQPGAVIRILNVQTLPYREISTTHTQFEGPGAREVTAWRAIHWPYWTELLARSGKQPSEDMMVVFQHFEVLHVAP